MAKINKVTTNGTTYELQDYDLNDSLSKIVGIVKSNQGSLSNAVAGIDYDYPVLKGKNAPTTSTVGAIGQHYLNTSATKAPYEWVCVKISGSTYTWVEVGNGAGSSVGGVNSNLLDNWYFANAVNNRGQTEYSGTGYNIDRWQSNSGSVTKSIVEDGVKLTAKASTYGWIFWQILKVPADAVGQAITGCLLATELIGTAWRLSISFRNASDAEISSSTITVSSDLTIPSAVIPQGTVYIRVGVYVSSGARLAAGDTITLRAAKLELGTQQTLAHQDADGNWVLNEIPDYTEQLLRCCMSTADSGDTYANNTISSGNKIITTPSNFRVLSTSPNISVVDSDSNTQGVLWQTNNQTVLSNRNVSGSTANHRSLVINNSVNTDLDGALQLYTATNSTPEWYPILHTGNTNRTKLVSTETEPENSGEIYWVYK